MEFNLLAASASQAPEPVKSGRVIAVQGVSGGSGRSTLALNLAFELASTGQRVCLVDADDQWPSLHRYFALPKQQAAVTAAIRLMDSGALDSKSLDEVSVRLVAKGIGVDFLSGFGLDQNSQALRPAAIEALLTQLKHRFDAVVVDAPIDPASGILRQVAAVADRTALVVLADPINLARLLDIQNQIPMAASRILVVNRLRASVLGVRPEWQVQQLLRDRSIFKQAAIIPEDPIFDEAMMRGLPLRQIGGRGKALQAMAELAARIGAA